MVLDAGLSFNLWNDTRGYIRGMPAPKENLAADGVVNVLRSDSSPFRILPVNYERSDEGLLMYYDIQSAGGQLPNSLQSYQGFIGAGSSVMFQAGNLMMPNLVNQANVKYVIGPALPDDVSHYDARTQQYIAQFRAFFNQPALELTHAGQRYSVYRNRDPLPRAFMALGYEVVKDKDEVVTRLSSPGFDPGAVALLYEAPSSTPPVYQPGVPPRATITSYDANRVIVRTQAAQSALLVLSENYHRDWKASLDGKPVPVLRAFHTSRAVEVPTGEHEVVVRYDAHRYRTGGLLTLASLVFLAGTVAITLVRRRRPVTPLPKA